MKEQRLISRSIFNASMGVAAIIVIAAFVRLLPHPPNFTPIIAMALLSGARFSNRRIALGVVFASMLLSDVFLGFHSTMIFVYLSLAIVVYLGGVVRNSSRVLPLLGVTCISAVLFFLLTNFGVWALQTLYAKNFAGLIACYIAALPFFKNQLLADLLFTAILFGGAYALSHFSLRPQNVAIS